MCSTYPIRIEELRCLVLTIFQTYRIHDCRHLLHARVSTASIRIEMKNIISHSIICLPIKIASLIFLPESLNQFLRLCRPNDNRLRLFSRFSCSALAIDHLLVCRQECSDQAERQADSLATVKLLGLGLGLKWPVVVVYRVEPLGIRFGSHHEHGVVGQRDALDVPGRRRRSAELLLLLA